MAFNLCKIGIHDYQSWDDRLNIIQDLKLYLSNIGLHEYSTKSNIFSDGFISIETWSVYGYQTLESCLPCTTQTKVCVNCGKITRTYSFDKIKKKLDDIISEKYRVYHKKEKAKSILERNNDEI